MSKTPLADIKPTHTSTSVRRKRQRTYQTDRLATLFSKCFHMLFHLILKIILRNRCYHSYLVYKETDLKKLRDLSKVPEQECGNLDLNPSQADFGTWANVLWTTSETLILSWTWSPLSHCLVDIINQLSGRGLKLNMLQSELIIPHSPAHSSLLQKGPSATAAQASIGCPSWHHGAIASSSLSSSTSWPEPMD